MAPSAQVSGVAAVNQPHIPERKPDYFIGTTGRPVLTPHFTTVHRSDLLNSDQSENVVTKSKLNKCLYNLKVRNGGRGGGEIPTGNSDRHGSIVTSSSRRVSNKTDNDITTIPKYSSTGGRRIVAPPHILGPTRGTDTGRNSIRLTSGWCSIANAHQKSSSFGTHCGSPTDRSRSTTSPSSSRLLTARSNVQQYRPNNTSSTRSNTGPPEVTESSLVLQQPCRYSNHHKLLDNRLTNQRSYDRNIFGYDQRMDQFVLPPLQI